MAVTAILAHVACRDIEASAAWYAHLFGREADARPMDGLREWYLGAEAGLQLLLNATDAGRGTVTMRVGALDLELARLGLASPEEIEQATHARVLRLQDPDGNIVMLVETPVLTGD